MKLKLLQRKTLRRLLFFFLLLLSSPALAEGSGHGDPVAPVVFAVALLLFSAKLGGDLAMRIGQPAVLGELLFGVLLGNLVHLGFDSFEPLKTDASLDMLSRLGVILLLFEVGLESTVPQMLKVGLSSLLVALLGVIAPMLLGFGVGQWLLPEQSVYVHIFLGATLTATSVGITARVLKDLNQSQSAEARVILGAAVLDDVLGLVILAVVGGIIQAADQGRELSWLEALFTLGKSAGFLVGSLFLGVAVAPRLFSVASKLKSRGVLLAAGLCVCFFLAYLADLIGLAPIVGAFAAGLILDEVYYQDFVSRGEHGLEHEIQPITSFLVPIFFVLMGMRTDLSSFTKPGVFVLSVGLLVVAIIGKQVCGLGVLDKKIDRVSVGIGMLPRGEVGLIFANIGQGLTIQGKPMIDANTFSAVVVVVIVTTMITPPLLKWALLRAEKRRASSDNPAQS
jgi:Kef-type K+ transport system membrane component KefB